MNLITQSTVLRLQKALGGADLKEYEMRRVEGMGGHYISLLPPKDVTKEKYLFFFGIKIENREYFIYRGTTSGSAAI